MSYRTYLVALIAVVPAALGIARYQSQNAALAQAAPAAGTADLAERDGMIRLPGGEFLMGTPRPSPNDQRPVHQARVAPFWIDTTPVTNAAFRAFVEATGHLSTAEAQGWSYTFDHQRGNWHKVEGVSWRHPTGPESSLVGKENYPVVHVSWHDAVAYATWAKKRLPTETEYEYAARGGLSDASYPWGRELLPHRELQANYWQGKFPLINLQQDGYFEVAPTRTFPANPYGLYDMAGNVACWCFDWYAKDAYGQRVIDNPQGPKTGVERVLRGGSWASTAEPGAGLHVGDRDHAPPEETSSRIGFRCARDVE